MDALFRMTRGRSLPASWQRAAGGGPAGELLEGLFGPRGGSTSGWPNTASSQERELYQRLARRPYPWLAACASSLRPWPARRWAAWSPRTRSSSTPRRGPAKCNSTSRSIFPRRRYRALGEVSPVIRTLATEQFDDYVKRVRIFAHPRVVDDLRAPEESARAARRGDPQDGIG